MNNNSFNQSQGANPLRRDTIRRVRLDKEGRPCQETVFSKTVSLSPEGSLDQEELVSERFHDCGHTAEFPMGGRCGEPGCFRVSCLNCFAFCSNCNVGLCLYHARRCEIDGKTAVYCAHCLDKLKRRRFWKRFWSIILSPLLTFDNSKKTKP